MTPGAKHTYKSFSYVWSSRLGVHTYSFISLIYYLSIVLDLIQQIRWLSHTYDTSWLRLRIICKPDIVKVIATWKIAYHSIVYDCTVYKEHISILNCANKRHTYSRQVWAISAKLAIYTKRMKTENLAIMSLCILHAWTLQSTKTKNKLFVQLQQNCLV